MQQLAKLNLNAYGEPIRTPFSTIFEHNGFRYVLRGGCSGYSRQFNQLNERFDLLVIDYLDSKLCIYTFKRSWTTLYMGFCDTVLDLQAILTRLNLIEYFPHLITISTC